MHVAVRTLITVACAGAVLLVLAGTWAEYQVATTVVPRADELRPVTGLVQSCEVEPDSLVLPTPKLHGGWVAQQTYLLTLQGIPGRFRTAVFNCGLPVEESAAPRRHAAFSTTREAVEFGEGAAPLYNTYGLAIENVRYHGVPDDLEEHRQAVRVVSPINVTGLLLLTIVALGAVYRWMTGSPSRSP